MAIASEDLDVQVHAIDKARVPRGALRAPKAPRIGVGSWNFGPLRVKDVIKAEVAWRESMHGAANTRELQLPNPDKVSGIDVRLTNHDHVGRTGS